MSTNHYPDYKENHMADQLQLVQVLPNNVIVPMITSAQSETEAATTMDRYPDAGYHFIYADLDLKPLTPAQELDVFA